MTTITTRAGKGSPLTNTELDNNFTNLNTAKYESGSNASLSGLTVSTGTDGLVSRFAGAVSSRGLEISTVAEAGSGSASVNFNVDSGSTVGTMTFSSDGSEHWKMDKLGGMIITPAVGGHAVFNESGLDADFRVESDTNTHALFVDASANLVNIGDSSSAWTAPSLVVSAPMLNLSTSTARTTNAGIVLRPSSSVDTHGWYGMLFSNSTVNGYGYTIGGMRTGTTGNNAALDFRFHNGDSSGSSRMYFTNGVTTFNEDSANQDFRVESDTDTHMLFVDAANNRVGIGAAAPQKTLEVEGDIQLDSDNASLWLKSGAAGTHGYVNWTYNTEGSVYAKVGIDYDTRASTGFHIDSGYPITIDYTLAGSDGLQFAVGGTTHYRFINAGAIFNEGGSDLLDFRVESDTNSNMLFVDASVNRVAIGGNASPSAQFIVHGSTSYISGTYHRNAQYSVPTATWVDVYWNDTVTTLNRNYAYEFACVTTGTGTDTGAKYLVWYGSNNTWNIRESGRSGFGSNHVKGRVDSSKFQIATDHGSTYSVRVSSKATLHGNAEIDSSYFGPEALMRLSYGSNLDIYGKTRFHTGGSTPDATTDTYNKGVELTGGNMRLNIDVSGSTNGGSYIQTRHTSDSYPSAYYVLNLNPLGGTVVVNNESATNGDFRVESDTISHMLFVDASENVVKIGTTEDPQTAGNGDARLIVGNGIEITQDLAQNSLNKDMLRLSTNGSWSNSGNSGYYSDITWDNGGTKVMGKFGLRFGGTTTGGQSEVTLRDMYQGGFGASGEIVNFGSNKFSIFHGGMTINEDSIAHDFRVESDAHTHAIFLDASTGQIFFGNTTETGLWNGASANQGVVIGQAADPYVVVQRTAGGNFYSAKSSSATDHRHLSMYDSGSEVGRIESVTGGVTYNTTSDRRLKDNIEAITDGTEKLMAMKPVTHTWKDIPMSPTVHGFIAQEMIEVVPEAVTGDPTGEEMMAMDYGRITPVLVAALQDAHKKIAELEARLNTLEGK